MKYAVKTVLCLALGAGIFLSLTSCNKDVTATGRTGNVLLHFTSMVDTNTIFAYNTVYTVTGGRKVSVNMAQLYISNIELVKSDGSTYTCTDSLFLKTQVVDEFHLGTIPEGDYTAVKFNVGISPWLNDSVPSLYVDSLRLSHSEMWLGATAQPDGYVFVNFQGSIDTTDAATGAQLIPFTYKLGTNGNLKTVTLAKNFSSVNNQSTRLNIAIDYAKLLNGLQLNEPGNLNVSTATDNAGALATQVSNNIPLMFSYQ